MSTVQPPDLESTFASRVVRAADADYDELRKIFNGMFDRRPSMIARCRTTADVVAAVNYARENESPVSIYSGGHGVTGHAVCDEGLVIDMREFAQVSVDPEAKTAKVGGGTTWGVVDAATTEHNLAVTGGRVPGTGVAGLTLGSGSGWLERKCGLTCDSLRSCEIVTADGSVERASEDENGELFWGLRGGGGNFGVVTEFEFGLHEIPPLLYAGMVMRPAEDGEEFLKFFRDFMTDAPDEVGAAIAFISAPPEDFVPEPARGQPVVAMVVCYAGDPDDGPEAMRPLMEWGNPVLTMVEPMPYVAVQQLIAPSAIHGSRNYWAADFCEMPDEACEVFARLGNARPSPLSQALVIPGGGAIARVDDDAMAFGQRSAPFNVHVLGMWMDPAEDEANVAWSREFGKAIKPHTREGAYLNFIGEEGGDRVREAFGPEKFARLQALKDQYDPGNLFRLNQNIPPSGG